MSDSRPDLTRRQLLAALGGSALIGGRVPATTLDAAEPGRMLEAYQKIFASVREEDVCCWYLGTMFIRPDGMPEIPVLHAVTIMVYRIDHGAPSGFKMRWTEVGCFRDPVSGGQATTWLNPLSGESVPTPRTFRDGPGEYLVSPAQKGLSVRLNQTGAIVDGVDVALSFGDSRIFLQQIERKRRRLSTGSEAVADADLPSAVTTLSLWADRMQVEDPGRDSAAAAGTYSFESDGLPGFRGLEGLEGTTIVRGIIKKSATDEIVNPAAWQVLQDTYPDFFDADGVAPRWGA